MVATGVPTELRVCDGTPLHPGGNCRPGILTVPDEMIVVSVRGLTLPFHSTRIHDRQQHTRHINPHGARKPRRPTCPDEKRVTSRRGCKTNSRPAPEGEACGT